MEIAHTCAVSASIHIQKFYYWPNKKKCEILNYFVESINKYDSSASSTYKAITDDPNFTITYGTGGVSGTKATETVSVIRIYFLHPIYFHLSIDFPRNFDSCGFILIVSVLFWFFFCFITRSSVILKSKIKLLASV